MTPKEKAEELVNKYTNAYGNNLFSQKCALICVDEIINSSPSCPILSDNGSFSGDIEESTEWWQQVKTEIEKL